jgi:hypothetical protein
VSVCASSFYHRHVKLADDGGCGHEGFSALGQGWGSSGGSSGSLRPVTAMPNDGTHLLARPW